MEDIYVIGIDPAPVKGLTVFDPNNGQPSPWEQWSVAEAENKLQTMISKGVVIGWDAPLGVAFRPGDEHMYYARPIDSFLSKELKGNPAVSVLPFSGCPHWAISQHLLGYPRIGASACRRPLNLIDSEGPHRTGVVETHPAVAMWLLLDGALVERYKSGSREHVDELRNRIIRQGWPAECTFPALPQNRPKGANWDDLLDAEMSYLCAWALVNEPARAIFLGDATGGFAVPRVARAEKLQKAFKEGAG